MFCIKCGRKINADRCEYCGSANTNRSNNNYFKSSEMYEILNDKSDLRCVEVTKEKYVSQDAGFHEKDSQPIFQVSENAVSDDINENKTAIHRSIMSNRIKNVIIAVLCIAVVCISASYGMLLNKYNNVVEKSDNIKEGNAAENTENSETEISINDNEVLGNSSTSAETGTTESSETEISINDNEVLSNSSTSAETGTAVDNALVNNTNKKEQRKQKAESLYDIVKSKKYDTIQLEQILSLYKDKQPIMQFNDEYDYSGNPVEYDIEYAEKCISDDDLKWDNTTSCGELSNADATGSKKLMYYFMVESTYGKQYILADKDHVPDINDVIYIEPIDVPEKNLYYMARCCDEVVSMYIIIDNKVYDFS